jgi:hypothetical protein
VSPTTAGPEKVNFPSGYKGHVLYATVDRPDNKTVRDPACADASSSFS